MVLKSIRQLREGLKDVLSAGEDVAERLALAEVDTVIQTRVQGILIPSLVVAALFVLVEVAAALIGDRETLRIAVTTIVLAAGLYGAWALAAGIIDILPLLAVWASTRVSAHDLARLFLYQLILARLREAFTNAEGKPSTAGHIARYALKFSGRPSHWEGVAYRLADQIAPRMVRHAAKQTLLVLAPMIALWAYYRFQIYPDIIRSETGLGVWSAFIYPFAALLDAITGTDLRSALITG